VDQLILLRHISQAADTGNVGIGDRRHRKPVRVLQRRRAVQVARGRIELQMRFQPESVVEDPPDLHRILRRLPDGARAPAAQDRAVGQDDHEGIGGGAIRIDNQ
jgi:hypothetical protein